MRIWDYTTGVQDFEVFPVLSESNASVDVSPDGKLLAYVRGSPDGTLVVVDTTTFETVATLAKHRAGYAFIATRFSHDGKRLMATNRSGDTMLWETSNFAQPPVQTAKRDQQEWAMAFSPDGATIAVSSWSKIIFLLNAKTLAPLGKLEGHAALVGNVDFCPTNPRLLASISVDGTLRLWDTVEQRNLLRLSVGEAAVEGLTVRFSPDGKSLAVTGSYGVAFVLDLGYYDRAIAIQVGIATAKLAEGAKSSPKIAELKAWADQVTAMPWPRLGKYSELPASSVK
jgi:WD40 repeat protein